MKIQTDKLENNSVRDQNGGKLPEKNRKRFRKTRFFPRIPKLIHKLNNIIINFKKKTIITYPKIKNIYLCLRQLIQ